MASKLGTTPPKLSALVSSPLVDINRLGSFLMVEFPHELGSRSSNRGDTEVDVAMKLLRKFKDKFEDNKKKGH